MYTLDNVKGYVVGASGADTYTVDGDDTVTADGADTSNVSSVGNVIKGDARCASISAASIIAKVDRDALMCRYAEQYPEYHFDSCKGYHSEEHADAIRRYGLSPIHRKSFCTAFMQETLF